MPYCVSHTTFPCTDSGISGGKHKAQKWNPRAVWGVVFYAIVPGKILSVFCFESKIP